MKDLQYSTHTVGMGQNSMYFKKLSITLLKGESLLQNETLIKVEVLIKGKERLKVKNYGKLKLYLMKIETFY